jgi:hypothetical protein
LCGLPAILHSQFAGADVREKRHTAQIYSLGQELLVGSNHVANLEVASYFWDPVSHPKVVVKANSIEDAIVVVLKNPDKLLKDYFQDLLAN